MQKDSVGYSLHTYFSKRKGNNRLDGLLNDNGLIGIVEARDHDCIAMVAPFIAGIADRCSELKDALTTKMFVKFVDPHHTLFRYGRRLGWTLCEIGLFKKRYVTSKVCQKLHLKRIMLQVCARAVDTHFITLHVTW